MRASPVNGAKRSLAGKHQKAPTTAHVGQAVLLVNGGPPPSLALLPISASIDRENPPAEPGVAATLQSDTLVSVAAGFRRVA